MTAPGDRPPARPETTALTAGRSANGPSLATPLWATTTFEPEDVQASLRQRENQIAERQHDQKQDEGSLDDQLAG